MNGLVSSNVSLTRDCFSIWDLLCFHVDLKIFVLKLLKTKAESPPHDVDRGRTFGTEFWLLKKYGQQLTKWCIIELKGVCTVKEMVN